MRACTWITVLPVIVIVLGAIQLRTASATANKTTSGNENLIIGWIEKPPYLTSPTNESLTRGAYGMLRSVFMRYIDGKKCHSSDHPLVRRADSEFHMIELLRQNEVHVAAPVFEPTERRYSEFQFFKLIDYPGSEYITTEPETDKVNFVLGEVLKCWPLFAVTLLLTAIAGVIMWALVSLKLCVTRLVKVNVLA